MNRSSKILSDVANSFGHSVNKQLSDEQFNSVLQHPTPPEAEAMRSALNELYEPTVNAEEIFRDAVEQAERLRQEADKADEEAQAASRRAGVAREWHRFAREQYLNRAFYKPKSFEPGDIPWSYARWAEESRKHKVYAEGQLDELVGQFLVAAAASPNSW